jgi:ankyrin repeat protein/tetratricopeptide (TPR) repeat protein
MSEIQDAMQKLQQSSATDPRSRLSHIETILLHYAHEFIVQGTTIYEASLAAKSITDHDPPASNSYVAKWVKSLDIIRQDQKHLDVTKTPRILAALPEEEHTSVKNTPSRRKTVHGGETIASKSDESDDDLDTDLVKAALDTGTKAFKAREWKDAQTLLNEALRVLQQLPLRQRMFCDILDLHYKLAICTYYTQKPPEAEEALTSLVQQSASTDVHRGYIYDATHLLSQLYIRTGQIDRARAECEKALQARRRLLGKRDDASLESLALMAHIYVLQNNRALAKSCLSMIPETKRESILAIVESSLGPTVEHLDFPSLLTTPVPQESPSSGYSVQHNSKRLSGSTVGLGVENRSYGAMSTTMNSPSASPHPFKQRLTWEELARPDTCSFTPPPVSSAASIAESTTTEKSRPMDGHSPGYTPTPLNVVEMPQPTEPSPAYALTPSSMIEPPQSLETSPAKPLTRKQILEKVGCQPRDRLEEAVCTSDMPALTTLLAKKKSFWRSGLRKRVRPERVTALHFAALFNEIDMARRLIDANFNVNEIPFGYTTSLSSLHFAIGARQVEMVEFLIASGAKPSEPDTWSTLAGQLMSRSWLMKTLSDTDRDTASSRILAIMTILLRSGWNLNEPIDASGKTILHQAVSFWTGAYRWDLELRASITAFLCERGADPGQKNKEGKTPWDMAVQSDHRDIMELLGRGGRAKELGGSGVMELVELPGSMS